MTQNTNSFTADAATRTVARPARDLALLGIFDGPTGAAVLLRLETGQVERLTQDRPMGPLALEQVGDGWALIRDDATLLRLVLL